MGQWVKWINRCDPLSTLHNSAFTTLSRTGDSTDAEESHCVLTLCDNMITLSSMESIPDKVDDIEVTFATYKYNYGGALYYTSMVILKFFFFLRCHYSTHAHKR